MIQVVSLALVFLKLVGFFTVHYRVNILQWFPRMNLVHCGLRNWGKSWIQRFLCLNLWLLIFSWSKMHFNKSSMRVPFKSNCLKMPHIQRLFVVDDFPIFFISCSHSAVRRGTTTISWSLWGSRCTSVRRGTTTISWSLWGSCCASAILPSKVQLTTKSANT